MSILPLIRTCVFGALFTTFVVGMTLLVSYASRPGADGVVATMNAKSELLRLGIDTKQRTTVVMFYHPKCPCTQSSVRMLVRFAASFEKVPQVVALAFCPRNQPDSWVETSATEKLRNIAHTSVIVDSDGAICQRFGASISGHVIVIEPDGNVIFSGGITPSRAHEGDSSAGEKFVRCVNGEANEFSNWPVFGCPIIVPEKDEHREK